MTTVRQTVVQTTTTGGGQQHQLDNSLDALLEDLQTSVSRGAMNGPSAGTAVQREYREVRRAVRHQEVVSPTVQYLSPANPTTVVDERSASPMLQPGVADQRAMAYKTVSYQYNTSDTLPAGQKPSAGSPADARLRENLNELDSLLVDLHQAQRTGFGTPTGSTSTSVNRIEVSGGGIDPGLLEPLDTSTPAPPARQQQQQQQHVSRSVQYRQYSSSHRSASADAPHQPQPQPQPQLQPRRSTSAQRELLYDPPHTQRSNRTRSPSPGSAVTRRELYYEADGSPHHYRDKSPSGRRLHKEVYYETKGGDVFYDAEPPAPTATRRELYYETKSSSATLPPPRQDVYYETKTTSTLPPPRQDVYYETKTTSTLPPPRQDVYYETKTSSTLPPPRQDVYYETKTTTVPPPRQEVYYETRSSSTVVPSPRPERYREPSPPPPKLDPYGGPGAPPPGSVTTYRTYNYNTTSGSPPQQPYPPPTDYQPHRSSSPPPQPGTTVVYREGAPGQPPTKVTTTVRTYTYELPGGQPYPDQQYPQPQPLPQPPQPQHQPQPAEPTVMTYKYSSSRTTTRDGRSPEEQQPLLPRPFPTASPGPDYPPGGQPPKRLDDLMATFSDAEPDLSPQPKRYNAEKQMAVSPSPQAPYNASSESNAVAVVTPTQNQKKEVEKTEIKERVKTVNKVGPPVYYPPGVDMFAKKEESMAMRASGRREKGMYKYEAASESKMKSSSSSGAAVVPVCLPLCCAMPCVIM